MVPGALYGVVPGGAIVVVWATPVYDEDPAAPAVGAVAVFNGSFVGNWTRWAVTGRSPTSTNTRNRATNLAVFTTDSSSW